MRIPMTLLLSALLMAGCLQPENGNTEEPKVTCGPRSTLATSWDSKPFSLYSAGELVDYLKGEWVSSVEWSDGPVTDAGIVFAQSGEGLEWIEYQSPSSGIPPHQCEPEGRFLLEATVSVPARGWSVVIPLTFLAVPNMGPGWSGSGSAVVPGCTGDVCVAMFNMATINDLSGGWTGTLTFSMDEELPTSGPTEWSR